MIYSKEFISTSQVAHHYNELDQIYRLVWGEHVHHGLFIHASDNKETATERLSHEVARLLEVEPGSSVCDIGCGYGGTSRLLAEYYGAQVVGLTISKNQWHYALSQPKSPRLQFQLKDWLQNDLQDSSFDHLFSIESSEHMPDKARFFSEAQRVLKPGGSFVICAWLAGDDLKKWEQDHLLEPICREGRLPSMGTVADYKNFLTENGFQIDQFVDVSHQVKKTWTLSIFNLFHHMIRHPRDLKILFSKWNSNAEFAKTLFRIRLAYETGAMKYLLIKARRT